MMTIFYFVRHGETDWNLKRLIQGQSDIPLNANGEKQAKAVAKSFKKLHFDLAFSSDLLRAKRTAEIIGLEHNLEVKTTALLRERRFGKFEGESVTALRAYDKLFLTLDAQERKTHKHDEEFESDEELTTRFITFIRETAATHPGKTILVGTHGGIIRSFLIHLGYFSYEDDPWITNGAYVKIESDGVEFFIREAVGIEKRKEIS